MSDMTGIGEVLGGIYQRALQNQPHDDSDYINPEDGLLYCGKCHTPKQCRVQFPFSDGEERREFTPPVPCECRKRELEAEERRIAELKEMEVVEKLRKQSLMDERFKDQTFETFRKTKENAKALRLSRRYADGFTEMLEKNQGLLFYGDVGTGKTFTAACIANDLLRRRIPVVMTSFVKLLETSPSKEDAEKLIRQLNQAKLLIIDDLGAERGSEYALERVYDIVDSRYRAKLPMLLTTNVELADMQNAADIRYKRIYDRIFEVCYPVRFTGQSFRKTEAKKRWNDMKSFLEGDEDAET